MQPGPPLSWSLNPAYLTPVQQRVAVLELLRSMRMSPMDLLVTSRILPTRHTRMVSIEALDLIIS
jgi:hypothetical protein